MPVAEFNNRQASDTPAVFHLSISDRRPITGRVGPDGHHGPDVGPTDHRWDRLDLGGTDWTYSCELEGSKSQLDSYKRVDSHADFLSHPPFPPRSEDGTALPLLGPHWSRCRTHESFHCSACCANVSPAAQLHLLPSSPLGSSPGQHLPHLLTSPVPRSATVHIARRRGDSPIERSTQSCISALRGRHRRLVTLPYLTSAPRPRSSCINLPDPQASVCATTSKTPTPAATPPSTSGPATAPIPVADVSSALLVVNGVCTQGIGMGRLVLTALAGAEDTRAGDMLVNRSPDR